MRCVVVAGSSLGLRSVDCAWPPASCSPAPRPGRTGSTTTARSRQPSRRWPSSPSRAIEERVVQLAMRAITNRAETPTSRRGLCHPRADGGLPRPGSLARRTSRPGASATWAPPIGATRRSAALHAARASCGALSPTTFSPDAPVSPAGSGGPDRRDPALLGGAARADLGSLARRRTQVVRLAGRVPGPATSSTPGTCAAVAVAYRLGLFDDPGGGLAVAQARRHPSGAARHARAGLRTSHCAKSRRASGRGRAAVDAYPKLVQGLQRHPGAAARSSV